MKRVPWALRGCVRLGGTFVILLCSGLRPAVAERVHWFTAVDEEKSGAQIGLIEGDGAQEYGSIFYGSCRPLAFQVQFDDEVNAKIAGPNVYPLIFLVLGKKKIEVGFDTLKWSDVPGGWQAQLGIGKTELEAIAEAPQLAVEAVDNSHDKKVIGRIDYPTADMQKSFAEFIKACF